MSVRKVSLTPRGQTHCASVLCGATITDELDVDTADEGGGIELALVTTADDVTKEAV